MPSHSDDSHGIPRQIRRRTVVSHVPFVGGPRLALTLVVVACLAACGDDAHDEARDSGPSRDSMAPGPDGELPDARTGGDAGPDSTVVGPDGTVPTPPPPVPPPPPPGPCMPYLAGADPWAPAAISAPTYPDDHPRVLLRPAVRERLSAAIASGNRAAVRFRDAVDAQVAGEADYYEFGARNAALMYALTGETRYSDWAIEQVEAWVSGEESLIAAGERAEIAADSYLYVGPTLDDVMSTYDWCFDQLTPDQRTRWTAYAQQAVWNVWNHEDARWGTASHPWSGWSVDDPMNNYFYSFLRATMLFGLAARGEHPEADGWLDVFRRQRIGELLVPAFAAGGRGGGSREGTGYGTALRELFDLFAVWEASTGERLADTTPLPFDSMAHLVHATVPTADRLAPIGDHARDSTAALFDYHRAYLLALARIYESTEVASVVRTFLADSSVPEMQNAFMFAEDFVYDPEGAPTAPLERLHNAYYSALAGQIYVRSGWQSDAVWMGVVAGVYAQSHAHHDQGSFLLYRNEWLAYDTNIESHSGIRQEEELHNLVRFESGGETLRMAESPESVGLRALQQGPSFTWIALDARPAYARNGTAAEAITQSDRELVLFPEGILVVADRVALAGSTASPRMIWTLNVPREPRDMGGVWRVQGDASRLDVYPVLPAGAAANVVDWASTDDDVGAGYRLETSVASADATFFLHVLSVDGAAASVVSLDESGRRGVTIGLPSGDELDVSFSEGADGTPHIVRRGADGAPSLDCSLTTGVVPPPVLAP